MIIIRKAGDRFIECRIIAIEVSGIQIILNHTQCLTESLIMHNFSFTQEADWISNFRHISNYPENVIVSASCFLLCCHILMKVGNRIAFGLEFTCIKWNATGSLWPYGNGMINLIWAKSRFFDFFHREITGKLVNHGGNHFKM